MRCQALDNSGHQCRNKGIMNVSYHGENELYCWAEKAEPTWVLVCFCRKHLSKDAKPHKVGK
jgi:hypothetical protein